MGREPMKQVDAHCNECGGPRKHQVLATFERSGEVRDYDIRWWQTNELLQCAGCDDVKMRRTSSSSEDPEPDEQYFPPAQARREPRWADQLDSEYRLLLREVYAALHDGSHRLAAMGARTLLDMLLTASVGDIGGFEKKLKAMRKTGDISKIQKSYLEAALNLGHAASHRGHWPNRDDLNKVMDIVENLLQAQFVLQQAGTDLKTRTPARQRARAATSKTVPAAGAAKSTS